MTSRFGSARSPSLGGAGSWFTISETLGQNICNHNYPGSVFQYTAEEKHGIA